LANEEYISPELRESLTEYYRITSLENFDEVKSAVKDLMGRYGGSPDQWRVESHNEYWLELEAKIRDEFHIPGFTTTEIRKIKAKSSMKELFRLAGVPCPAGKVIETLEDAKRYAQEIGYPIVVKPDIGVGAADTFKLNNEADLERFFSTRKTTTFIFEQFIDGTIESFDGLTDSIGRIVFFTTHKFSSGIMEVVTDDSELFYYSERVVPEDLRELGFRVIQAAGLKEKFFHLEFFRKKSDGQLVALETNMRPPGGVTMDMFNFANDIDLYYEWANIIERNQFTSSHYRRPYHCCYVGRKERFHYKHSRDEIHRAFGPHQIVMSGHMPTLFAKVLGAEFVVLRTTSLDELKPILKFIQERYD